MNGFLKKKAALTFLFLALCSGSAASWAATANAGPAKISKKVAPKKAPKKSPEIQAKSEESVATDAELPSDPPEAGVEDRLTDALVSGSFPEKSDFIAEEEKNDPAPQRPVTATQPPLSRPKAAVPQASSGIPDWASQADLLGRFAYPLGGAIFLALVLAVLWRAVQRRSGALFGSGGKLALLAQQQVGPRSKIVIVRALKRKYLVGVTEQNIQLLADLDFYEDAAPEPESAPAFEPTARAVGDAQSLAAEKVREKLKGLKKI